eukprot:1664962-Prymnesium_polylepis.1
MVRGEEGIGRRQILQHASPRLCCDCGLQCEHNCVVINWIVCYPGISRDSAIPGLSRDIYSVGISQDMVAPMVYLVYTTPRSDTCTGYVHYTVPQ